ncbi:MAG: 3',5'-cyclic-nucleotide phosphodiesterase [Bacteriovoracaceae bacterium]|nr:3',5'-cyclic-nucleotide phosphodiesterase [Bacteriovoracaceae bacterium]
MLVRIVGGHGGVAPGFRATSYLVDGSLLIDAGSVASGLLIDEQIIIDNILISHPHLDHISDLAFLCDNCFGLKRAPFEVYSHKHVKDAIKNHLMNDIIWPDFTKLPDPDNPTIRFNDIEPEKGIKINGFEILPVKVNHPEQALGFVITKKNTTVLFTQDTGPNDRVWEIAKQFKNLKAIFTEVSFPNRLQKVATDSQHHTPQTLYDEIKKMPADIPLFIGHLKPNFQTQLYHEIDQLGCDRITLLGSDDTSYVF